MKATAPTLSEHLMLEAKRFRGYPGLAGRGRINRAVSALWEERGLSVPARSVEWIMPKGKAFPATPALLNEYYSKRLLAEIPGIVTRASALRPLECGKPVPRQVNIYHEQATRCFVAGLWDGAAALARACLEAALEERIGEFVGHQRRDLDAWITKAERKRLLSGPGHNYGDASRAPRRPARKARGGRIPGVYDRRATPRAGMHRRPNAAVIMPVAT